MPNTKQYFEREHPECIAHISYGDDVYEVLEGADALAICTEWTLFRTPDFSKLKSLLKSPVLFDGRNLFDIPQMKESGFYYNSIGRKTVHI